jgi:hypothetical protein
MFNNGKLISLTLGIKLPQHRHLAAESQNGDAS